MIPCTPSPKTTVALYLPTATSSGQKPANPFASPILPATKPKIPSGATYIIQWTIFITASFSPDMTAMTGLPRSPSMDKAAPMRSEKKIKGRMSVRTIALKTFEGIIPSLPVSSLPRNTSLMVLPIVRSILPDTLVAIGKPMLILVPVSWSAIDSRRPSMNNRRSPLSVVM